MDWPRRVNGTGHRGGARKAGAGLPTGRSGMTYVQGKGQSNGRPSDHDRIKNGAARARQEGASEGASVDGLIHTIEGEIIPRLLLAHQGALQDGPVPLARGDVVWSGAEADAVLDGGRSDHDRPEGVPLHVTPSDVTAFAELLITFEPSVAKRFIDAQVGRGHAVPDLLLDLCAPAAKTLGDMWLNDVCSFCDVTIGLSSLEQIILHCAGPAGSVEHQPARDRSVLLAPMPGNQHVFGMLIVKELFRRSGWTVRSPAATTEESLLAAVRQTRFSVLGLSLGSVKDLQSCQSLVKACRKESLNPKLLIMVGGHGIQEANMSTRMLDVDLIARDGREGLEQMERMVSRMTPNRTYN